MKDYIKKTLLVSILLLSLSAYGDGRKSPRDLMIIGRDFTPWDNISSRPVSIGLNSWYNEELGSMPAIYASAAMLTYKDIIRLEAGGTTTWNHKGGYIDFTMLTGFSTLIEDKYIVGIWMSPLWKLYSKFPDDPWGIMVGYAF